MPLPKQHTYTSEDYWNLPDGERAELIDGPAFITWLRPAGSISGSYPSLPV